MCLKNVRLYPQELPGGLRSAMNRARLTPGELTSLVLALRGASSGVDGDSESPGVNFPPAGCPPVAPVGPQRKPKTLQQASCREEGREEERSGNAPPGSGLEALER